MKYKMLFLDIDGTLVNSDKKITPKTKAAILKAAESGIITVIASGRPEKGVEYAAKELRLAENGGYIMPFNGGIVKNASNGKIICSTVLDTDTVKAVYDLSKKYGVNFITYKDGCILAEQKDEYIELEARINTMPVRIVDSILAELDFSPVKCLLTGEPSIAERAEKAIKSEIGSKANVFRSERFFVEIMPYGMDKAASINKFISKLNISRDEIIACGDGCNDITMINYAGLGVAMSNGCEQIKLDADYITSADNNHDGIAEVVNKFIFNGNM